RAGQLSAEGPLSPELTRLLAGPGELPDSPMAVKDREHLAFLDAALPEEKWIRPITALHGIRECAEEVYGLLEALAGVHAQAPAARRNGGTRRRRPARRYRRHHSSRTWPRPGRRPSKTHSNS
ncbi:hypothetical protein ACWGPC_58305, partial [Streptomyces mirabilis]